MSKISIHRRHNLSHGQALAVAKKVTADLHKSYGIASKWRADCARIEGSGISGELTVAPKRFEIDLKLGLLLMMFRDKIEAGIEAKLDELLTFKPRQSGKPAIKKG